MLKVIKVAELLVEKGYELEKACGLAAIFVPNFIHRVEERMGIAVQDLEKVLADSKCLRVFTDVENFVASEANEEDRNHIAAAISFCLKEVVDPKLVTLGYLAGDLAGLYKGKVYM